jgi:hypothetical protein
MKPPAIVVPATAGTHNPKSWLLRRVKKGNAHSLSHIRHGAAMSALALTLGVPACAGTTNLRDR